MPSLEAIPSKTLYRDAWGFLEHRFEATAASRLNPYSLGEEPLPTAGWLARYPSSSHNGR